MASKQYQKISNGIINYQFGKSDIYMKNQIKGCQAANERHPAIKIQVKSEKQGQQ